MREPLQRGVVLPPLVALGPVAGVQDDVLAGIVQARLVPPDLALLGHQPVLVSSLWYVIRREGSTSHEVTWSHFFSGTLARIPLFFLWLVKGTGTRDKNGLKVVGLDRP